MFLGFRASLASKGSFQGSFKGSFSWALVGYNCALLSEQNPIRIKHTHSLFRLQKPSTLNRFKVPFKGFLWVPVKLRARVFELTARYSSSEVLSRS